MLLNQGQCDSKINWITSESSFLLAYFTFHAIVLYCIPLLWVKRCTNTFSLSLLIVFHFSSLSHSLPASFSLFRPLTLSSLVLFHISRFPFSLSRPSRSFFILFVFWFVSISFLFLPFESREFIALVSLLYIFERPHSRHCGCLHARSHIFAA